MKNKFLLFVLSLTLVTIFLLTAVYFLVSKNDPKNITFNFSDKLYLEYDLIKNESLDWGEISRTEIDKKILNNYIINLVVKPIEPDQEKGSHFTVETVYNVTNENIAAVDVNIEKDNNTINIFVYINGKYRKETEDVVMEVNKQFIKGLLYARVIIDQPENEIDLKVQASNNVNQVYKELNDQNNLFISYE